MTLHLAFWVAAGVLALRITARWRLIRSGVYQSVDSKSGYGLLDAAGLLDSARLALLRARRQVETLRSHSRAKGDPNSSLLVEGARTGTAEACARAEANLRSVAANGRTLSDRKATFPGRMARSIAVDCAVLALAIVLALSS